MSPVTHGAVNVTAFTTKSVCYKTLFVSPISMN